MQIKELLLTKIDPATKCALQILSKENGYMSMYLDLCMQARNEYKKNDFYCKIFVAAQEREKTLEILGWVMVQNLLYRHKNYAELNIYVTPRHRGKGVAKELIKKVCLETTLPLIAWASTEANIALYKKFRDKIKIMDMKRYERTGEYIEFNYENK